MSAMTALVEEIELRVTAPVNPLKGITDATAKVEGLQAAVKRLQATLGGLSSNSLFKLSARQYAAQAYTGEGKLGSLKVGSLAQRLGFPDTKDVQAEARRVENEIQVAVAKIQKRVANGLGKRATENARKEIQRLQGESFFTDASAREFQNPTRAGMFFEKYAKAALANKQKGEQALQALLMGAVPAGAGSGIRGPGSGAVPVNLAQAVAAPGGANHQSSKSKKQGNSKDQGSKAKEESEGRVLVPSAGAVVESKVEQTPEGEDKITTVRRTGRQATESAVVQEGRVLKLTTRELAEKAVRDELRKSLAQLETEFRRDLPRAAGSAKGMAKLRSDYTRQAQQLFAGKEDHQPLLDQFLNQTMPGAADSQRKAIGRRQRQMAKRRELAVRQADKASQEQAEAEIAILERRKRDYDRFAAAGANAQAKIDQAKRKAESAESGKQQQSLFNTVMTEAAQRAEQALQARGARLKGYSSDLLTGRRTGSTYSLDEVLPGRGAFTHTFKVDYSKQAGAVRQVSKELKEAKSSSEMLGGDFVKNTLKVAAWSASVGLLYNSVELVTHSFERMLETGYTAARLDQVFRKVGGATQELTSDVLHLAAANGRSTEEAMASALQWARLGLSRVQVNEAVKISLMAANDAGTTAEETTEALQAIMQTYGLKAGQLRTLLAELVYVTNNFNVSTNDMLTGLSRTAAAAKQAGLPLAELQGILAATIGNTGQSGANIGNALKSVTLALSNPALQDKLRTQVHFEPTQGGEDIKGMSELLGDLYVKYMKLNDAQRQSLLFSVAGRTQANRLAAMMTSYVQAQTLAINAQLNLNNAEEENTKITSTLKAQLAGVASEWERLVVIQSGHGPLPVLQDVTVALRNVLQLMNAPGMRALTTGVLAVGTVALGRSLMATLAVKQGMNQGFIGRSGAAVMREVMGLNGAVNGAVDSVLMGRNAHSTRMRQGANGEWTRQWKNGGPGWFGGATLIPTYDKMTLGLNRLGDKLFAGAGAAGKFSLGLRGLGVAAGLAAKSVSLAMLAVSEFAVPVALVYGGIKLFNAGMESLGTTIEGTEEKLAGFNRLAEKSRSAADAFAEAGRAMATFQQALSPERGMMRPDDTAALVSQLPALTHLEEPDPGERQKKQTAMRAELQTMLAQNDLAGIRTALDKQAAVYVQARLKALQAERIEIVQSSRAAEDKLAELKAQQKSWYSPLFARGRQQNIDELEKRRSELDQKNTSNLVDQTGTMEDMEKTWQDRMAYDKEHLIAVEREKLALESIAEIYAQIETHDPVQKAQVKIAGLAARREYARKEYDRLLAEDDRDYEGSAKVAAVKKGIEEQLAAVTQQQAAVQDALKGKGAKNFLAEFAARNPTNQYRNDREELGSEEFKKFLEGKALGLEAAGNDLQGNLLNKQYMMGLTDDPRLIERAMRERTMLETVNSTAAGISGEQGVAAMREKQRQRELGAINAARAASGQKWGRDEADKLDRERLFLNQQIQELSQKQNRTEEEDGELLKAQGLAYESNLAIRQRQVEVEREIHQLAVDQNKEFARSFFGSGPAEMLKKLAAFKMALGGPLPMGQLMQLSPGLRGDVGQLTGQNPEMWQLLREQGKLGGITGQLPAPGGALQGFADGGYTGDGPSNQVAGVVHKGEYVLNQQDLFNLRHDNLYAPGSRLLPGGGIYRPAGLAVDDMDELHRLRVHGPEWTPRGTRFGMAENPEGMAAAAGRSLFHQGRLLDLTGHFGYATGRVQQYGRQLWSGVMRWGADPEHWMTAGKDLGTGLAGGAVTGGLNWLGSRMNTRMGSSDHYGGAAYGLFTDAAGGAVAGSRGGPMGAAIGAVSGMVTGDVARYYHELRELHQNTRGAARFHHEVAEHQAALQRQQREHPKLGADFYQQRALQSEAHARDTAAFEAKMAALNQEIGASTRKADAAVKRADQGVDWAHPAGVSRGDGHVIRTYKMPDGRYAQFVDGSLTPEYAPAKKKAPGFEDGGYTGDGPSNQVAGVVHKGEYVLSKKQLAAQGPARTGSGDLSVLTNATEALSALAGAANTVNAAFAALAARTEALFRGGGGGGMQFQTPGQVGGWSPGMVK
jgi:TP901 family phage tail tape measure protein